MSPAIEFPDNEERQQLRARVLGAIALHKARHPLQAAIEAADTVQQCDYLKLHDAWRDGLLSPHIENLAPATFAWLRTIDAIRPINDGWNCLPFSTDITPFRIETATGHYHALSAIDALAMPALLASNATLHGNCHHCGMALSHKINLQGGLDELAIAQFDVITDHADTTAPLCNRRPPSWLLCPDCQSDDQYIRLRLPQASTIGNAFYGFIGRLRRKLGPI